MVDACAADGGGRGGAATFVCGAGGGRGKLDVSVEGAFG